MSNGEKQPKFFLLYSLDQIKNFLPIKTGVEVTIPSIYSITFSGNFVIFCGFTEGEIGNSIMSLKFDKQIGPYNINKPVGKKSVV